jgi:large-conductance mechanosensitive channel
MQYHIGCSGWSYSAWLGPFYPSKLGNSDWLRYYSQVFDYVDFLITALIVFLAYKQLSKYKLVEDKTKPPAEEKKL